MAKDLSCVGEVALGPWGCNGGSDWSYRCKQAGNITQVTVGCEASWGSIKSIMFKGQIDGDYSHRFGVYAAGDNTYKIDINFPSEFLTGISGTYSNSKVNLLNIHTNKKQYGPFGGSGSNEVAFSVKAKGGAITGFHGRSGPNPTYIAAIGVYVMPDCLRKYHDVTRKQIASSSDLSRFLSLPRGAGPKGGDGGREWDDGVFSAVKGVHVVVGSTETVSAVRFCYLKSDGSDFVSPFHGRHSDGETHIKMLSFDKDDEYLVSIEGFYGQVKGNVNVIITSLTFITNKAKYGPIGEEIGTFFTFVNSVDYNGKVVGFHGRSGAYLDAIGLHTQYHV